MSEQFRSSIREWLLSYNPEPEEGELSTLDGRYPAPVCTDPQSGHPLPSSNSAETVNQVYERSDAQEIPIHQDVFLK